MKTFNVPIIYRSPLISAIKRRRKEADRLKKDFTPMALDFGPVRFHLARHFGFCYGVENAIEIAFRTVEENPGRRIYLLSEMIHNPFVNADLNERGVQFLMDTKGKVLIPLEAVNSNDIVIIPAFGTTLTMEATLRSKGIQIEKYDTTCPFVEKVWNRSEQIARSGYTIIIHGKPEHEETRATFSHSQAHAPALVIRDMEEAQKLAAYLKGQKPPTAFKEEFEGRYSDGFDPEKHFGKIGVVNQTTMLASETQAISDYLKEAIQSPGSPSTLPVQERFADTRDTLCYATNDNQTAVMGMLEIPADMAIIVGGRNSSNTSHLVELCEEKLPTYFIRSEDDILSGSQLIHYNWRTATEHIINGYMPEKEKTEILITSGASCPDALVEAVMRKIISQTDDAQPWDVVTSAWTDGS